MLTKNLARTRSNRPFTGMVGSLLDSPFFADDLPFWGTRDLADQRRPWVPAVDLGQSEDAYLVVVDLPGLEKKDITLTIEQNTLSISGERTFETKEDGPSFDRVERSYGKFSRSFQLPSNVDPAGVKASFKNGVLTIQVPKAEEAKSRQIVIS